MKRVAIAASLVLAATLASAEETLARISWGALKREGRLATGEVRAGAGDSPAEVLRLVGSAGQPTSLPLATLDGSPVTRPHYALAGRVRHEAVAGQAYLEMWSVFASGERYFSRTLATSGPSRSLHGTSRWRPFLLPFRSEPGRAAPRQLELNAVLPGGGTVELGDVRLVQYAAGEDPFTPMGAWWNDRTAGLVGAAYGSIVGCLGGLMGLLVSLGRGRSFVLASLKALAGLGVVSLAAGVAALLLRQPYGVYYPLLLSGAISAAMPFWALPLARRRYQEAELRRVRARDVV
jgi:hypothetical protein